MLAELGDNEEEQPSYDVSTEVVRGSSDEVIINSNPTGAEVSLSSGQACTTPCSLELKRKGDVIVVFKKQGYKELSTALISAIDGVSMGVGTFANLLFLPIVNDLVDYRTGANYSLKPNPLFVQLIPLDSDKEYQLVKPDNP